VAEKQSPTPGVVATPQSAVAPLAPSRANPTDTQMRSDLTRAQALLDLINGAVASSDWEHARQNFAEFEQRTVRLPAPQLNHPDISPVMQDFFLYYKVQLSRGLAQQSAPQARFAANQLYGIVSEQRARMGTRGVPLEFQRLHFLIREVELWEQAGDGEMVKLRTVSLMDAWKEVRPVILARRNGASAARNFDALTEKLVSSASSAEMAGLFGDLAKGFETMSGLFQNPPRPPSASPTATKPSDEE